MTNSIRRELTAMSRRKPSAPLAWAYKEGLIESAVFDWGCGKGMDSRWLKEEGLEVISYDPFYNNAITPDCVCFEEVRTILLIYILNIIEDRKERESLLYDIKNLSQEDTTVIIAVPRAKQIESRAKKSTWKSYSDGFVTKRDTFQKGYTLGEFADDCMKIGKLRQVKKLSGSLVGVVSIGGR